jgi:uncharacterized protein YndB with AHSA1/START domain
MPDSPSSATPSAGVPVTVCAVVRAAPETVFAAWTTPESMRRWGVTEFANDPRAGGRYRQETRMGDDVHVVSGEYREWAPGRRLVMTWDYTGPGAEPSHALVTVDLRDDGAGGTQVTVTESPIDPDGVPAAQAAWSGALAALDAMLSGAS